MKKILLIICILSAQICHCAVTDSNNSFEIELSQVPEGGTSKSHNDGLSNGAVTAITLGSIFGGIGALSAIGYYFLKHASGLACGFACGEKCPYQLVGIENPDFIKKHTYLAKAYEYAAKNQKYLIIPDTQIKPKTYNVVFFEIPEDFVETDFKIIQSSDPINNTAKLDTDIFSDDKNLTKIPTSIDSSELSKGILLKQGKITAKENEILTLTTSNQLNTTKTYAIIVVFEKP